jgi:tetratricopeptide (TPR) repeat protein
LNRGIATGLFLLTAVCLLAVPAAKEQAAPPTNGGARESAADFSAKLNPDQKQVFLEAGNAYREKRYSDALALQNKLLKDFPDDPILLKFASEAAIQSGDAKFAASALKPIAQSDPDDWQAAALLVRACAESGDVACRDAQIARLSDMHDRNVLPPRMREFAVEKIKVGEKTLLINLSVVPWGYYKVCAVGDVSDGAGKLLLTISLESNDFDQPGFAKEHPDEAAKGVRQYSLDAYEETGLNSSGQRTQTHYTYKFFTGQPNYATIRQEFMDVANGKSHPVSSRSGLVVQ